MLLFLLYGLKQTNELDVSKETGSLLCLALHWFYFYHIIKIDTSELPIPMVYRSEVV